MFYYSVFLSDTHTATSEIYTLSLHDALPIYGKLLDRLSRVHLLIVDDWAMAPLTETERRDFLERSEEHTSELQSPDHLVCRLLLEKKKKNSNNHSNHYNFNNAKHESITLSIY